MVVLSRLSIVVPTLLAEQLVDTSSVGDITLGSMTHSVIAKVQKYFAFYRATVVSGSFLYFENSRVKNPCLLVSQYVTSPFRCTGRLQFFRRDNLGDIAIRDCLGRYRLATVQLGYLGVAHSKKHSD